MAPTKQEGDFIDKSCHTPLGNANGKKRMNMYSLLQEKGENDGCFQLAFNEHKISEIIIISGEKLQENCSKCVFYNENLHSCYFIYMKLKKGIRETI